MRTFFHDLGCMMLPLFSFVVLLLLAGAGLNTELGFDVWPMGEARNWLWLLQNDTAGDVANAFWQHDARNPLSPWWHIFARSAFENVPSIFLILQLGAGALLGISTYLTLSNDFLRVPRYISIASGSLVGSHGPAILSDSAAVGLVREHPEVPYSRVSVLEREGHSLARPGRVSSGHFSGRNVIWERSADIVQD